MKKLYLTAVGVAIVLLGITILLFKIMPTGSYVPFIPWLFYIVFLIILENKRKKLKKN
ncbi:MAG: hypothetical protein FWH31_06595 [Streptococcaceae bacterium]|nr:hypothetical protein [Streptococcaceae bacterium]